MALTEEEEATLAGIEQRGYDSRPLRAWAEGGRMGEKPAPMKRGSPEAVKAALQRQVKAGAYDDPMARKPSLLKEVGAAAGDVALAIPRAVRKTAYGVAELGGTRRRIGRSGEPEIVASPEIGGAAAREWGRGALFGLGRRIEGITSSKGERELEEQRARDIELAPESAGASEIVTNPLMYVPSARFAFGARAASPLLRTMYGGAVQGGISALAPAVVAGEAPSAESLAAGIGLGGAGPALGGLIPRTQAAKIIEAQGARPTVGLPFRRRVVTAEGEFAPGGRYAESMVPGHEGKPIVAEDAPFIAQQSASRIVEDVGEGGVQERLSRQLQDERVAAARANEPYRAPETEQALQRAIAVTEANRAAAIGMYGPKADLEPIDTLLVRLREMEAGINPPSISERVVVRPAQTIPAEPAPIVEAPAFTMPSRTMVSLPEPEGVVRPQVVRPQMGEPLSTEGARQPGSRGRQVMPSPGPPVGPETGVPIAGPLSKVKVGEAKPAREIPEISYESYKRAKPGKVSVQELDEMIKDTKELAKDMKAVGKGQANDRLGVIVGELRAMRRATTAGEESARKAHRERMTELSNLRQQIASGEVVAPPRPDLDPDVAERLTSRNVQSVKSLRNVLLSPKSYPVETAVARAAYPAEAAAVDVPRSIAHLTYKAPNLRVFPSTGQVMPVSVPTDLLTAFYERNVRAPLRRLLERTGPITGVSAGRESEAAKKERTRKRRRIYVTGGPGK